MCASTPLGCEFDSKGTRCGDQEFVHSYIMDALTDLALIRTGVLVAVYAAHIRAWKPVYLDDLDSESRHERKHAL